MSRESADSWKQKYLANLERLERQERQLADVEQLMRHGIARLCLIGKGANAELDRRLEDLRKAARGKQDAAAIHVLLDGVDEAARQAARIASAKCDGAECRRALVAVLDAAPLPDDLRQNAVRLREQVQASSGNAVGDLVAALVDLLMRMGATPSVYSGKVESQPTMPVVAPGIDTASEMLLDLIQQLQPHGDATLSAIVARIRAARVERELRVLTGEIARHLRRTQGNRSGGPDLPPDAIGVLSDLLGCIPVPAELVPRIGSLKERLAQTVAPGEWPELLAGIATLISHTRDRIDAERSELENFLLLLTERLSDLDMLLHGAEQERQASFESGRELDRCVTAEVSGMESSVRHATSLEQVRMVLQDRIGVIRQHMEEHRQVEALRQAELEEKLKHVTSRLHSVEQETTHLRAHLRKRKIQAMSDPLTGVPNRMAFEDRLAREYGRWKRYRHPLTLMILDVDHFKQINDTLGHKAGDKALQLIAMVLRQHLRETDFIARYGGEEFAAILSDTPDENVAAVAEKLRRAIELSEFHHCGQRVPITISCGYAAFRGNDSPDEVFQRADAALYRAKAGGRNRCDNGDLP